MIQFKASSHILFCISAYQSGKTFQEIADIFGCSRQYIEETILSSGYRSDTLGGVFAKSLAKKINLEKQKIVARKEKARKAWGCSEDEYKELCKLGGGNTTVKGSILHRYKQQKANAKVRGVEWNLSLMEWWRFWQESGKWDARGRGEGYCMARTADTGPYQLDNIYITSGRQNSADQYLSGKERDGKKIEYPNAGKIDYADRIFSQ